MKLIKPKKKTQLTMESKPTTLAVKCYDEQMPWGWEDVIKRIKALPPKEWQVLAILHDRDLLGDDIWLPSAEKRHFHIIVRMLKNGKANRIRIKQILEIFGVVFRNPEDNMLFYNRGVETTKNFSNYAMYLTHDTEQAILDGKEPYEIEEIVSNLTPEEVKQIRDGYVRVKSVGKVGNKEMAELDALAFKLGWELGDFGKWYGDLSFMERSHSKMKTIENSFYRGVKERVEKDGKVNRLCVFIKGDHNEGKTYAVSKALQGKKVLEVECGGTGRFDALQPSTEAIVVNDDTAPYMLSMSDNKMCQAYKRGSNNPFWCGTYFVVTSNKSFSEWASACGIDVGTEEYEALCSRFYICHTVPHLDGGHVLYCDSPSTRGTKEEQEERLKMFCEFRDKVNESMLAYRPEKEKVDYSNINSIYELIEPEKPPEPEEQPQEKWHCIGDILKDALPIYEAKGFVYSAERERYENPKTKEYILIYEDVYFT